MNIQNDKTNLPILCLQFDNKLPLGFISIQAEI